MKIKDTPEGQKLIGSKWAFKLKRNGVCCSRLVVLGYAQVPGVDFMDGFSGVAHDITLRIALIMWMVHGLDINQLDVETAFSEGELNEGE